MPVHIQKHGLKIYKNDLTDNTNLKILFIHPIIIYIDDTKYSAPLALYSFFNNTELAEKFLIASIQLMAIESFTNSEILDKHYTNLITYCIAHIRNKTYCDILENEQEKITFIETILFNLNIHSNTAKINSISSEFKKAALLI